MMRLSAASFFAAVPEGGRAMLQPQRQIDALGPATRSAFEAEQAKEEEK